MAKSKRQRAAANNANKPSMDDLDNEPKFIELPSDYEDDEGDGENVQNERKNKEKLNGVQEREKREKTDNEKKNSEKRHETGTKKGPSDSEKPADTAESEEHKEAKVRASESDEKAKISDKLENESSQKAEVKSNKDGMNPEGLINKDPAPGKTEMSKTQEIQKEPVIPGKKQIQKSSSKEKSEEKKRNPKGDCAVCGYIAGMFCSSCKFVFYCTREHQKAHWKKHKEDCVSLGKLPYRIERNDTLGRHLVATKDIPAGTLILNESPMIVGPRQLSRAVCLGCHLPLTEVAKPRPCSRCHWPVCSDKCQDSPMHDPECRLLQYGGTKVNVVINDQINMMYASITVLRALALKNGPQEIWKDYTKFSSHLEERMKTEVYTKVNKEKVVFFIHHYLRLLSKFSDLEILEACGKLDTNCFEIRQMGRQLRAMYRTACLVSHDCVPNTKHTFDQDYSINLYATINIGKGDVISVTYTQPLWPTFKRREHLHMSKCFWCKCARCQDPTELGTYLSCLNCSSCGGKVMMVDPVDHQTDWKCDKCGRKSSSQEIKELEETLVKEIKELDRTDPDALEHFLKSKSKEIILSGKELLKVAEKIDPGLSKWRGQLLFELQSASAILAQRAFQENKLTAYQAKELLAESASQLKEAVEILSVEPDSKEDLQSQMKHIAKLIESIEEKQ